MRAPSIRVTLVSLLAALAGVSTSEAAARVFVSVNGNDANNCSVVGTPCRTFSQSIIQVDAGGEVIVLDTGSYGGTTINKSVKINVPSGVVAFTAQPFVITAGATDVVVLRGLTIKALTPGTGTGISFTAGSKLYVENCVIDSWNTGIDMVGPGQLFVKDTTVRNSGASGLRVLPGAGSAQASIDLSRFEGNLVCGVRVMDGGHGAVRDSVASGNDRGFCAEGTGEVSVLNSVAANNTTAGVIAAAAGSTARVASSIISDNGTGLSNGGGLFESLGNNLVRGNTADTSGTITTVAGQ